MKLIDLGDCEVTGTFALGTARAAWTYWNNSSQWHVSRTGSRVLLIEGQPDRFPELGESVEHWLQGRFGSFRGFEITQEAPASPAIVRAFVDPLCTRPLYYFARNNSVCIADKLATVVINTPGGIEPDWSGLFEGAALGTLYSRKTTCAGAVWVEPGQALEFESGVLKRTWKNTLPSDSSFTESEVAAHPAETLRLAIEKAIDQTWSDTDIRLLLSGGLDSRILLMLAPGKRKALSLELYTKEARITEQVAEAAGAELQLVEPPDSRIQMTYGYLATGAMHDSRFVSHLGLVQDWRRRGVPGVTHGYFHNTMYRGWTAGPYEKYPERDSILYQWMGHNAYYLDKYGCKYDRLPRQFHNLLTNDGKTVLERQLRELSDSLVPVMVEGYDLTFERRLMEFVSRQIYFCVMLGWYEGVDVVSPVFQPPIWTWYALSHPRHRDRDWAVRELFLSLSHPAAKLPDANTGERVVHLPPSPRDKIRNQFWYPAARAAKRMLRRSKPSEGPTTDWCTRFRKPNTIEAIADGISILLDNPLFDRKRLQTTLDDFRNGNDDLVDTIDAAMTVGQWQRLATQPTWLTDYVRVLRTDDFAAPQEAAPKSGSETLSASA